MTWPQLPAGFWAERPELAQIRDYARCKLVSPDAVFGAALARAIALVPPRVVLPGIVGPPASLNFYVGLIGRPGAGKSAAIGTSAAVVDTTALGRAASRQLGSGEGLINAYLVEEKDDEGKRTGRKVPDRDGRSLWTVDEGSIVSSLGSRQGSTLLPVLRSVWSGSAVGQENAHADTTRHLPEHSYRAAIVFALQTGPAARIVADADLGLPQRLLWLSAADSGLSSPDLPCPDDPSVKVAATYGTMAQAMHGNRNLTVVEVDESVTAEVKARVFAARSGDVEVAAMDEHSDLLQLKVAFGLARLNGRWNISDMDWLLAEDVIVTSRNVRSAIVEAARTAQQQKLRAAAEATAYKTEIGRHRQAVTEDQQLERDASRILELLRDGPLSGGVIYQRLSGSGGKAKQKRRAEAITHLIELEAITVEEVPGGFVYSLGT